MFDQPHNNPYYKSTQTRVDEVTDSIIIEDSIGIEKTYIINYRIESTYSDNLDELFADGIKILSVKDNRGNIITGEALGALKEDVELAVDDNRSEWLDINYFSYFEGYTYEQHR